MKKVAILLGAVFLILAAMLILVITGTSSADAKPQKHRAPSLQESRSVPPQGEDIIRPSFFFPGFGSREPNTKQEQRRFLNKGSSVSHPVGCPSRAFCGCGASVAVFGHPIRSLYLASAWFKFPRSSPQSGAVAVRRGHVFVLRHHIEGKIWMVYDANSGGHRTRIHERSITGYTIVMPTSSSLS